MEHQYAKGDIVMFRPNWPSKPAFGIWMKHNPPEGQRVRISGLDPIYSGTREPEYHVQFDPDGDGTFHDCHWPAKESEILGYAA